jgi:hypothetical protein
LSRTKGCSCRSRLPLVLRVSMSLPAAPKLSPSVRARRRYWSTAMKIRYENTLEDMIAFSRYHSKNSPMMQRSRMLMYWVVGPLVIVVIFGLFVVATGQDFLLLSGAIALALYLAAVPFLITKVRTAFHDRLARRLYAEGANKGAYGPKQLELTEAGLIGRSEFSEATIAWPVVERVASTIDYTFIYFSAVAALVIPRAAVSEGDYEVFVEAVRQKVAVAQELKKDGVQ